MTSGGTLRITRGNGNQIVRIQHLGLNFNLRRKPSRVGPFSGPAFLFTMAEPLRVLPYVCLGRIQRLFVVFYPAGDFSFEGDPF